MKVLGNYVFENNVLQKAIQIYLLRVFIMVFDWLLPFKPDGWILNIENDFCRRTNIAEQTGKMK